MAKHATPLLDFAPPLGPGFITGLHYEDLGQKDCVLVGECVCVCVCVCVGGLHRRANSNKMCVCVCVWASSPSQLQQHISPLIRGVPHKISYPHAIPKMVPASSRQFQKTTYPQIIPRMVPTFKPADSQTNSNPYPHIKPGSPRTNHKRRFVCTNTYIVRI